jgi:hypothetical protein
MPVFTRPSRSTLSRSSALSPFFGSSAAEVLDYRIEMREERCWVADGVRHLLSQRVLVLVQAQPLSMLVSLGLVLGVVSRLALAV